MMSNKCPQCGFPEHESGECPYARPKGEKYDYVEGVLMPKAEPSLVLTVVDFGESCVVKLESGSPFLLTFRDTFGHYSIGQSVPSLPTVIPATFSELRSAIDSHFAESKPVPRVELFAADMALQQREYILYSYHKKEAGALNRNVIISDSELDALNVLARAAGATKDLPIYEPKGTWTRLNTHDWTAARQSASEAGYGIDTHSYEDAICPVKIWRYEY